MQEKKEGGLRSEARYTMSKFKDIYIIFILVTPLAVLTIIWKFEVATNQDIPNQEIPN